MVGVGSQYQSGRNLIEVACFHGDSDPAVQASSGRVKNFNALRGGRRGSGGGSSGSGVGSCGGGGDGDR